jgi:hypothetical protein
MRFPGNGALHASPIQQTTRRAGAQASQGTGSQEQFCETTLRRACMPFEHDTDRWYCTQLFGLQSEGTERHTPLETRLAGSYTRPGVVGYQCNALLAYMHASALWCCMHSAIRYDDASSSISCGILSS